MRIKWIFIFIKWIFILDREKNYFSDYISDNS